MATVSTQAQFRAALDSRQPEIILQNDITLTAHANITYAVTIKGVNSDTSLLWGNPTSGQRNMLIVEQGGTATLESIILDAENRDGSPVFVDGGTLIVNDGTTVRNVSSTTAQSGIVVGSFTTGLGGTLIMNGGVVTAIDSADAVFAGGGTVFMHNNAAVRDNAATGVTVATSSSGGPRATFTMTGNSRICGNRSKQGAGGVILYGADMFMGVNEDDSPEISDNRPPAGSFAGGLVAADGSTLTMGHNAKIYDNYTDVAGGGILAQDSLITMSGSASITGNTCDGEYGGGGARIHRGAKLTLKDNATIADNISATNGGGIYLQPGGDLELQGNARVEGNTGENGAGIYLAPPSSSTPLPTTATIGGDTFFPTVCDNNATGFGGGVYIAADSKLSLCGYALIDGNTAQQGAGIYKEGSLELCQSPRVLDGLYFDDLSATGNATARKAYPDDIEISAALSEDKTHLIWSWTCLKRRKNNTIKAQSTPDDPHRCDNVPLIVDCLNAPAEIHLEGSPYVCPPNVCLVIADKGPDYAELTESDRAAWHIPPDFDPDCAVTLHTNLCHVLISHEIYNIQYCHLHGTDNPNPATYSADSEFPIVLQEPGERQGYEFDGWYDCSGQPVTEITQGMAADVQLVALWKEKKIYPITYCHLYGASNPNPPSYNAEKDLPLVLQKPGKRQGYEFIGWYNCAGQQVSVIPKGTTGAVELIALWREKKPMRTCLRFDGNADCVTHVPEPIEAMPGEFVKLPPYPPKRPCYCFIYWNTCPRGSGKSYVPGGKLIMPDKDITLYAIWKPFRYDDRKDYWVCTDMKRRDNGMLP